MCSHCSRAKDRSDMGKDEVEKCIQELQTVWETYEDELRDNTNWKGIRSSQVTALVRYLVMKGVLFPDDWSVDDE